MQRALGAALIGGIAAVSALVVAKEVDVAAGLVGHWKLAGDARDYSGSDNHATNRGADLEAAGPRGTPRTAARFDGRGAYLEVAASDTLRLGHGDLTAAAWVHVDPADDDLPGDILSKFDPASRRGFNFGILTAHSPTCQANRRQVHFGIDNGRLEPQWTDCGRPGNSVYVMALTVHDGGLYAGTCEPGADEAGHVYRYEGEQQWHDCGSPDPCNAVSGLASFDSKLYAGVSRYRVAGSALPDSPNLHGGGKVYRYDGDGRWTGCGKLGETDAIGGMAVFRGALYATSLYAPAGAFRYAGGTQWVFCGTGPDGKRINALGVFNGHLYGTSYDGGFIHRYEGGTEWSSAGEVPQTTQTYGFAAYQGKLHVSTWPNALVYRLDGQRWTNVGRPGMERESMGLAVHNGKLYTGTLPLAEVHRFDGGQTWTPIGQLDHTPDVRYRRVWTMANYQGRLYCGVLPSGHVLSIEAGRNMTYDRELPNGWHHLAAIRSGDRLRLYVDGKEVATSSPLTPDDYDLDTDRPLRIGLGQQDFFHGRLSDVRLYRRALTPAEIAHLARR